MCSRLMMSNVIIFFFYGMTSWSILVKEMKKFLAGGVFSINLMVKDTSVVLLYYVLSLICPILFNIFTALFMSTTGNSQLILPFDPPL